MLQPGRHANTPDYRYGFNNMELDNEIKGEGNSYDFGARMYDPRVMRWLSLDPAAKEYASLSGYVFVANMPMIAIDPDGKRVYFVAGAGNDLIGWNYSQRFKTIWESLGIKNVIKLDVPSGSDFMASNVLPLNDMIYVTQERHKPADNTNWNNPKNLVNNELNKRAHHRAASKIIKDLKKNPLAEGEQLNLTGYSYGSVVQAQAALLLADEGYVIDNLILIGAPISEDSDLYKKLLKYEEEGKIGQVIRKDFEGDYLSNPTGALDILKGARQNATPDGPHFDMARQDNPDTTDVNESEEADKEIKKYGKELKKKGVE